MSTPPADRQRETGDPSRGPAGVVDNPAQSRFELDAGDGLAVGYYRVEGDRITLLHTEVPQELSGRGIGSRLAKGVFETLRGRGVGVIAECPFMASYAARHPEYSRMLVG